MTCNGHRLFIPYRHWRVQVTIPGTVKDQGLIDFFQRLSAKNLIPRMSLCDVPYCFRCALALASMCSFFCFPFPTSSVSIATASFPVFVGEAPVIIPLDPSSGNSRISLVLVWHVHDMFTDEFRARLSWMLRDWYSRAQVMAAPGSSSYTITH